MRPGIRLVDTAALSYDEAAWHHGKRIAILQHGGELSQSRGAVPSENVFFIVARPVLLYFSCMRQCDTDSGRVVRCTVHVNMNVTRRNIARKVTPCSSVWCSSTYGRD